MKRFFILSVAAFGIFTARSAEIDSMRYYKMDDLVVTSTRTPLPLKNTPVITRVISSADIERQGIPTLEGILEKELAGVEFHQAGYGTTMSFQGLDARYVLILVDGERMAGETYGNIDYSRIPISNIDRIEIVRGASSVLYGSNAMGAVVNIITRMPRNRFEISGSVRYGTTFQSNGGEMLGADADPKDLAKYRSKLDLPNTKSDLSVGFNLGKFRSLTTATFRTVDAYKLVGTGDERRRYEAGALQRMGPRMVDVIGPGGQVVAQRPEFDESGIPVFEVKSTNRQDTVINVPPDSRGLGISGWRDWYIGQKFEFEPSEKFRFELSGNYTDRNRYDFQTSIMDDNPMSGILGGSALWAFENYRTYNARFLMEHSPNENNKVYLSYLRDESFRDVDSLARGTTHKQRHTYNNPRLLWTYTPGTWNRLTTGLEMLNEQLRFDLNPEGYDDKKILNSGALYVQDEMFSGRKLSFVLGVRGDWSDQFGFRATPKVSAKYTFSDFSLRANYSNGYRTPNLKEMFMVLDVPIASAPQIVGNPDLDPETNHYLSLSLDYNLNWLNASVTVNKSYFRNKIDARRIMTDTDRMVLMYDNIDKSEYGSLELITRIRIAKGLVFNANYNYIFQQNDNAPDGTTQYIFPSPHTATFNLAYSWLWEGIRFSANANVRYIGPKEYDDFMPYIDMDFSNMSSAIYYTGNYKAWSPGYAVCGLAFDIETPHHIALTLGVDNLFNYQPEVVSFNSALTAARNGFIKLSFSF